MNIPKIIKDMIDNHGDEKVIEAWKIVGKLYEKSISELEDIKSATTNPKILQTINLVIKSKINSEDLKLEKMTEEIKKPTEKIYYQLSECKQAIRTVKASEITL